MSPAISKGSTMNPGEMLEPGSYLTSDSKRYKFIFQEDGNLVLYDRSKPLWTSLTACKAAKVCFMQRDGNLVVYSPEDKAIWNSGTNGNQGSRLVLEDEGEVVIYSCGGTPIWSTKGFKKTYFRPSIHGWPFGHKFPYTYELLGMNIEFPCTYEFLGKKINLEKVGFCGGMCWESLRRFYSAVRIPRDLQSPGKETELYDQIKRAQEQSCSTGDLFKMLEWQTSPQEGHALNPWHSLGHRTQKQWEDVKRLLDRGNPVTLTLISSSNDWNPVNLMNHHRVVAYHYEIQPADGVWPEDAKSRVQLWIYDPKYKDRDDIFILFYLGAKKSKIGLHHSEEEKRFDGFYVDDHENHKFLILLSRIREDYPESKFVRVLYGLAYFETSDIIRLLKKIVACDDLNECSNISFEDSEELQDANTILKKYPQLIEALEAYGNQGDYLYKDETTLRIESMKRIKFSKNTVKYKLEFSWKCKVIPYFEIYIDGQGRGIKQCQERFGTTTLTLQLPRKESRVSVRLLDDLRFTDEIEVDNTPSFRCLPYIHERVNSDIPQICDAKISNNDDWLSKIPNATNDEIAALNDSPDRWVYDNSIYAMGVDWSSAGVTTKPGKTIYIREIGNIKAPILISIKSMNLAEPVEAQGHTIVSESGREVKVDHQTINDAMAVFEGFSEDDFDKDKKVEFAYSCTDRTGLKLEGMLVFYGKSLLSREFSLSRPDFNKWMQDLVKMEDFFKKVKGADWQPKWPKLPDLPHILESIKKSDLNLYLKLGRILEKELDGIASDKAFIQSFGAELVVNSFEKGVDLESLAKELLVKEAVIRLTKRSNFLGILPKVNR